MKSRLFLLAFALFPLISCTCNQDDPTSSGNHEASTLASLKQVDDFPLYTMTYAGDYGFATYLKTGTQPILSRLEGGPREVRRWGCTGFAAIGSDSARKFGRNFDWHDCLPLLLFTAPPGAYASVSMVDLEYFGYSRSNLPNAAQNGSALLQAPYMPFDGLNEKGVAIGMMAVPSARSPYDPSKVSIGEIQAIRLVLDYAADVSDAIQLFGRYNIRMEDPPIHYLVSDRSGESAVIEFVDGVMCVFRGPDRWLVSTNFVIQGSNAPGQTECWRYNSAYSALRRAAGVLSDSSAISLLQQVSQTSTIWSTLYNMENLRILVAPGRRYQSAHEFVLSPSR